MPVGSRFGAVFYSSMKGRLTLGVALLLIPVGAVVLYVIDSMVDDLDRELVAALRARAVANAKTVSGTVGFELATKEKKGVLTKLRGFRQANGETESLAVMTPTGAPFVFVGKDVDASLLLKMNPKLRQKGGATLRGDVMVAVWPVRVDDDKKIAGYVVYTESLAGYRAKVQRLVTIGYVVTIGLFLAVLLGVFVIGHRTAAPMNRLMEAAQKIAAGDLENIDVPVTGSAETRRLAESILSMAAALQGQVRSIKQLTSNVSTVSREVAGAMTHLASSAVQQAAAVTETASTVEEMEQSGQSAADNANQITESSEKTTEGSVRGRRAVERTSELIMRIQEDSQEISSKSQELLVTIEQVSKTISAVNDIAEQSKILAVNASIEAAKAGEYGAGFAVVAQEVKDLALQSKEATVQITATLGAVRQAIESMVVTSQAGAKRTEEGVKVIANAGAIVNDLSEAIRENSDLANVIASSIKQQTIGLTQIATAVDQINSTALDNQEISRKISDETIHLTGAVEELSQLVDHWKTPDAGEGPRDGVEAPDPRSSKGTPTLDPTRAQAA